MTRILKAWVMTEKANGNVYWQGLDSLLAPFVVLNFCNEARAYACFKAFIHKYFEGFFGEDNSVALGRMMGAVKYVLAFHDVEVTAHFRGMGITPDMFAIPWVMTMFAQVFQLDRLYHLWDTLLLTGKEFPVFLVFSIVHQLREQILGMDFSSCLLLLSELQPLDVENIIYVAFDGVCFSNHHIQGSIHYNSNLLDLIAHKSKSYATVVAVYSDPPETEEETQAVDAMVRIGRIGHLSILVSDLTRMPANVCMCCCGATPQCVMEVMNDVGL
ncbi:hypothetical protein HDU98_003165 [Podochytrium sp. JEL0797]|nr:hypothetical protein HDU98_003165 [Podochytrium sp. JEL0797]